MQRSVRIKASLIALLLAGVLTSFALAGRPEGAGHGKGAHPDASVTTTVTVTTTTTTSPPSLVICHPTRSKAHPYVKVDVPADLVWTRVKHGDVVPSATGACPSSGGSKVARVETRGR